MNLQAEDVDLAIRWQSPGPMPPGAIHLVDDVLAPTISPRLLREKPLRTPADLARWPLLDLDENVRGALRLNWNTWFEFAGAGRVEPTAGRLVFSFVDQAVQAARARPGRGAGALALPAGATFQPRRATW